MFPAKRRDAQFCSVACSNAHRHFINKQRLESFKADPNRLRLPAPEKSEETAQVLEVEDPKTLVDKMNSRGLSIDDLLETLADGLKASTVTTVMVVNFTDGEGKKSSVTKNLVEVPEHTIRHKYLETALALHGLPEKKKGEGDGELPYHERLQRIWNRINKEAVEIPSREVK